MGRVLAPGRVLALALVVLGLAGCGLTRVTQGEPIPGGPIPVGPLAPVLQAPDGRLVECRGVPRQSCFAFLPSDPSPDVVRTIITCTAVCTEQSGELRVDLLHADGQLSSAGGGGYASEVAP